MTMLERMMRPSDSDVDSVADSRTELGTEAETADSQVGESTRLTRPADDAEIREYGHILGANFQETDMPWLVREAFEAPLPKCWTEHMDAEGRVYFYNQVNEESTWAHPMDGVYRELILLIQTFRAKRPTHGSRARLDVVKEHLELAHRRAIEELEGWSGPYDSENGLYFYNERLGVSTWVNPSDDLEYELAIRQSVLYRCLLPDFADPTDANAADVNAGNSERDALDPLMRFSLPLELPLGSIHEAPPPDDSQLSSRTFYSARESSRSGHSERSLRELRDALNSPSRALKSSRSTDAKEVLSTALESCREEGETTLDSPTNGPLMGLNAISTS